MSIVEKPRQFGQLSSIDEILEDARQGRMFVLVDAEDRENEGDLVIPAAMATPAAINFMAKYGRGLICLALTEERASDLQLELMARSNQSRHTTNFTVSIEAREGITTGISAYDRAHTIATAIDPGKDHRDIVSPGHVFPLVARSGGALVRAGHTEAAVDIARLSGLYPAGVICEIMNDDGTMARLSDLLPFAAEHNLKVGTIADLIAYRRRTEKLVRRVHEGAFTSRHGGTFRMVIYSNDIDRTEHVALIKGDVGDGEPVLVRMHAVEFFGDVLGEAGSQRTNTIAGAMEAIAAAGRGVMVLIRQQRADHLSARFAPATPDKASTGQLRDYGAGAQILQDLGVRQMILLSNSRRQVIGLDGHDLTISAWQSFPS